MSRRLSLCGKTKSRIIFCLILSFIAGRGHLRSATPEKLDGIVLLIADGTSLELITAARVYAVGASGGLALEKFPHTALVRTHSASDSVTDSGASATAMARGIKTHNRFDWNGLRRLTPPLCQAFSTLRKEPGGLPR